MKYNNSLNELKTIKSVLLFNIFDHYIFKKCFLIIMMLFCFTSEQFEISLVLEGTGELQNFINEGFNLFTCEVTINNERKSDNIKSYEFENGLNNVTIKFNEKIEFCQSMFEGISNIIEIDLSKFDASEVINMTSMFKDCINLEKITFGNINTSQVQSMDYLFYSCIKLSSIDLSHFDTSSVRTMEFMFAYCESLSSLDLSSFNTENVVSMHVIFEFCYKLTSINVSSFNTSKVQNMRGMFYW